LEPFPHQHPFDNHLDSRSGHDPGRAEKNRSTGTVTISGVVFDKTIQINGHTCDLIGAGLLRYRVVFKGYVAALYLERGKASGDVFKDIPKSLVIEYFRAIDAEAFISSTRQGFMNNLSREQMEAIDQGAKTPIYRESDHRSH
jgi:hypothetical protein